MIGDIRDRAEAVMLQFEQEVGMIERGGYPRQRHRVDYGEHTQF